MDECLLEVRNLKKYFPVKQTRLRQKKSFVRAVDGVSFTLQRGEILGLVGESGSGKTTVGKTILNLLAPTGGAVTFEGQTLFDVEGGRQIGKRDMGLIRRNMQMVFQDPYASLDPRMNVEKIITEGIVKFKTCPRSELHGRAELIQECGLEADSLKKFPHQFSGGQRQRIGIARAISLEPKLIVCDEPTAALDVSIQSQILNLMLSLKERRGMSYLFISHNLGIVEHFCTRVCVMYLGSIVEVAPSAVLFRESAHPYTRALLESTPSVREGRGRERTLLSGEIPSPANPPSGCKFHPRCPYADGRCRIEMPGLHDLGGGHLAACHRCGT